MSFSSSWLAWPETCTAASGGYINSAPRAISLLIRRETSSSLPRNRRGGQDDGIAGFHLNLAVRAFSHASQCRFGLAL